MMHLARFRRIVPRAAVALTMSVITGATAGMALARWPVSRPSAC